MKKLLLSLLFINSFLKADYYNLGDYNLYVNSQFSGEVTRCISGYRYNDSNNWLAIVPCPSGAEEHYNIVPDYDIALITDSDNNIVFNINYFDKNKLSSYEPDSSLPLNYENLQFLGLSENDLNFSFAISGILMSFLFLYGIVVNI